MTIKKLNKIHEFDNVNFYTFKNLQQKFLMSKKDIKKLKNWEEVHIKNTNVFLHRFSTKIYQVIYA